MKTQFQLYTAFIVCLLFSTPSWSQNKVETDSLAVTGVCEMCKERIEDAAFVKGVKWAEWDANTQQLVVIYKTKKTDLDQIADAIALAGHDNGKKQAPDEAYAKLPDCCAYRDGVKVH